MSIDLQVLTSIDLQVLTQECLTHVPRKRF